MKHCKVWLMAGGSALVIASLACHSSSSAGPSDESACNALYLSLIAPCELSGYPQSEITRVQARWNSYCTSLTMLPGWGASPSDLEDCAQAAATSGCANGPPTACAFILKGTLAAGAACVTGAQCTSGGCSMSDNDGGPASVCGTCAALVPVGSPCGGANTTCGPEDYCGFLADGGQACLSVSTDASATSSTVGMGASCDTEDGGVCGNGLACAANDTCQAATYAAAGQPCDEYTKGCLVGSCANASVMALPDGGTVSTPGVCPTVISDGEPCEANSTTSTCDTFATCAQGTCLLTVTPSTCM